jgi:cytochrome c6
MQEATPPCAVCHTLADAGASGAIGPDLDQLRPSAEQVRAAIRSAPGAMPAYDSLTEQQVDAVARYVAEAAGG